jgi:hypothetical protein
LSIAISNPDPVRATKRRPPSWRISALLTAMAGLLLGLP